MIRNIYHKAIMIMAFCTLSFASCQVEDFDEIKNVNLQKAFTLNAKAEGMSIHKVSSRGSDAKTQAESEIKDLHFFIFASNGTLLQHNHLTGGTTSLMIESTETNATVYAIANIESGKISGSESMTELDNFVYIPSNYNNWLEIPDTGMPMVGKATGISLNIAKGTYDIPMKALMARVDMNISVNSTYADADRGYPQLTLTNFEMNNMSKGAPFTASSTTPITTVGKTNVSKEVNKGTIYNGNGEFAFTFYVFENIQNPTNTNPTYPTGIKDDEKQAYKPLLANGDAINFKFTGNYVDHNGSEYLATYTLYLGKNHTNDFTIVRNHQYKNNIAITGLNKTNLPGGSAPSTNTDIYSFDARINVELSNNFYVNLLRERDFDAHCCVAPMDIYVSGNNTVTVEILNPTDANWVRMENVGAVTTALQGMRDYFTTDLVTNTLANNTSTTITGNSRIYLYVDENVDVTATDYGKREAQIKLTSGEVTKIITIQQAALLPVVVYNRTSSGVNYNDPRQTIYIEVYEEYLNHYDPLDSYDPAKNLLYNGLAWGAYNQTVGNQNTEAITYYNGVTLTNSILFKTSDYKNTRTLKEEPTTAAEYCYHKGKRNTNGTVSTTNGTWFLPAIRQMEAIMRTHYANVTEFQENYYWSSAPAKRTGFLTEPEVLTEARATRAYIKSDGTFGYRESGTNSNHAYTDANGTGGRANRNTILRIRAAYIPN